MIDVIAVAKVMPILVAGLMSPGPDFMFVSSTALARGRQAGMLAACGIAAGVFVYVVLCLLGVGVVFDRWPWMLIVIRVVGGAYLVYLGFLLLRGSFVSQSTEIAQDTLQAPSVKGRNPFLAGFYTNMTNPKAVAFFTSIFAFALPAEATASTKIAMAVTMTVMSVIWFGFVSYGLSAPSMRKVYMRWSRWIDRVSGAFLGFFGMRLLLSTRN